MKTQIYGISIGMRLCTERTKVELPILTSATRTRSSLPLKTLLTRPSFQSARFFLSLTTKTTSPSCTVAPLRLLNCLSWVTYSDSHRRARCSWSVFRCLNLAEALFSFPSMDTCGHSPQTSPISIVGVSGHSLGSSSPPTCVSGRLLTSAP